ncbi:MAG: hypothetical protein U9N61_12520, partial [Euryarchaeota archaeon]|nr:hypothetical protein [Euryarchaeota archaeon]
MIVCLTFMLLSITSGLVSGEDVESTNSGVFFTDHQATTPAVGNLQVNVDNINGYPVANVYVYVDGEERALICPFGYIYIEDVPYGDHRIDIRYSITNPDYIGYYQKSLDMTVDEEKEVVNVIATLPESSYLAQAQSLGDSSNFTR